MLRIEESKSKDFIERGNSATAANRTEFIKALDYCSKNKDTEAFIVWKIDRFARNSHRSLRCPCEVSTVRRHTPLCY